MKKIISLSITALMLVAMTGCSKTSKAVSQDDSVPVKVMEAQEEKYPILLEYLGNTDSKEIIKYSFKTPGKIATIPVKEGDYVSAGQVLATLDTKDYNMAVNGSKGQVDAAGGQVEAASGMMNAAQDKIAMAKAQVDAAKSQYNKALNGAQKEDINRAKLGVKNAEDTYNYAQKSYDRVEKLYNEGIVSKQQLDDIKIKKDGAKVALDNARELLAKAEGGARSEDKEAAKAALEAAEAQYKAAQSQYGAAQGQVNAARGQLEAAETQYESKQSLLDDTILKSQVSGFVTKVINKPGENTAPGYPVVVVRTDDQIIDIQIAQNDIDKIKIGTTGNVKINDFKTEGTVVEIEQVPDPKSRTYKTKMVLKKQMPKEKFYVGTVANISIKLQEQKGVWLPLTVVLNDGEDYVYIVEKGRVARRNVKIVSLYGDKVLLEGIKVSDEVINEGLKNVKPGYKVKIVK